MINFQYARADDVADAVRLIGRNPNAKFIAGGTNLIDLMKMDVERPTTVIDITRLPLEQVEGMPGGGLNSRGYRWLSFGMPPVRLPTIWPSSPCFAETVPGSSWTPAPRSGKIREHAGCAPRPG